MSVRRDMGALAGSVLAVAALVAALVAAAGQAAWARGQLDYPFGGVAPRLGEAAHILSANLRFAALILVMAAVAQLASHVPDGRARTWLRVGCDIAVLAPVALNVLLLGVSLGAYGTRQAQALASHGLVEIAAFCLVGVVYLRSRRSRLTVRDTWPAAAGVLLLIPAALLETFVRF